MTPVMHPDLEVEQEHIRRARRALQAEREAAPRAADAAGDPKAAAAMAARAVAQADGFDVPDEHLCIGRVDRIGGRSARIGKRLIYDGAELLVASWASKIGQQFYEADTEDGKGLQRRLRFELDGLFLRGIEEDIFLADRPRTTTTPGSAAPGASRVPETRPAPAPVPRTPPRPAPRVPRARPKPAPTAEVPSRAPAPAEEGPGRAPAPGEHRSARTPASAEPAPGRAPGATGPESPTDASTPSDAAPPSGPLPARPDAGVPSRPRPVGPAELPTPSGLSGDAPPQLRPIRVPDVEVSDALLRDLARGREPAMRDIVATITAGQYRLIREDRNGVLVVQGGPGTGKTAVALHRAAWLLINHRAELEATGVLVVGPNRAFMEYVGQVLPMLGERAVVQREVDHLGTVRRKAPVESREVRRVKGDPRMAIVLRRLVNDLVKAPKGGLRFDGPGFGVALSEGEVAALLERVRGRGAGHLEGRAIFERELARTVIVAANVEGTSRAGAVASTLQRSDEWRNALARTWPRTSARALVHSFLTIARRRDQASGTTLTAKERALLARDGAVKMGDAPWTSDDLPLIDEVAVLLGEATTRYGHVIVDEAQDLSPMQLRMIRRRSRGDLTLVGDLAQATGAWRYAAWDEVTEHLDVTEAKIGELTVSYRVPKQAMDLAATVQREYAPSLLVPNAIRPGAGDIGWRSVPPGDVAATAVADVERLLAGHAEDRTVGVIVGSALRQEISVALEARGIDFGSIERDGISRNVTVLPAAASKGLEFDHVVLVDPLTLTESEDAADDRTWPLPFLFVALTRATQSLTVIFDRDLPWPLQVPDGVVRRLDPPPAAPEEPATDVSPLPETGGVQGLGGRFTEALLWAKLLYDDRPRRGRTVPYFGHLMATAAIVLDDGGTEDEAIAALLHDVPEDFEHAEMLATIEQRFGLQVRRIVAECGDPIPFDGESWRDQKSRYLEQIEQGSAAARRVALAEKLDNARTLLRDHHRVGTAAYERLGASPADMHWYLESLATLFAREHEGALAVEFAAVIAELPAVDDGESEVGDEVE